MRSGAVALLRPTLTLGVLLVAMWGTLTALAAKPGFKIEYADTHWSEGVLQLNARVDFELSREAREALESGVPLYLVVHIEVIRPREYLWDLAVAQLRQRYRLRYHALSGRYVVDSLNTQARHSYSTLSAALAGIGRIEDLPILDKNLLGSGQSYYGQIRAALDVEALPTPMRVWAYVSSAWRLTSDWFQWPIRP